MCGATKKSWEHVWEECREWKYEGGSWGELRSRILGDEGEGESG